MTEAWGERTISGSGMIIKSDHLPIYKEVAGRLRGIEVAESADRKDDMGTPLNDSETRVVIRGVQNKENFWQMASEEIRKLDQQTPNSTKE